jgi:cytochrome oxidase Cu insertion factor (SCO1/SenC/PrrC family)
MKRIRHAVWNGWAIALVVGLGLLWHYAPIAIGAKPAALPDYGRVPPFTLIDQTGRSVDRDDLLGHLWIADFIFTRCAGQCPQSIFSKLATSW